MPLAAEALQKIVKQKLSPRLFVNTFRINEKNLESFFAPSLEPHLDLLLSLEGLNELPMTDFYQLCATARGKVKLNGYWALACRTWPAKSFFMKNVLALILLLGIRTRTKDLTHFISPEDWRVISDEILWDTFPPTQLLILERLKSD